MALLLQYVIHQTLFVSSSSFKCQHPKLRAYFKFQSLNNNGNALASSSTGRSPGFQTQANPFGSWFSAISNGLSYLLGGSSANNFGYPYSFGYLGYTERNPLPRGNNWYSGGSLYNYYGFTPYYYPSYQNYYSLFRG